MSVITVMSSIRVGIVIGRTSVMMATVIVIVVVSIVVGVIIGRTGVMMATVIVGVSIVSWIGT